MSHTFTRKKSGKRSFSRRGRPEKDNKVERDSRGGDMWKPVLNDEKIRQAYLITMKFGASSKELAECLDVSKNTVDKWLQRGRKALVKGEPENLQARFLIAVKSANDAFNTEQTEKALVKRATGYEYDEVRVDKTRISVKELRKMGVVVPEHLVEDGEVVYAEKETVTTKQVQPDTTAIVFYLQNRASNRWKNVRKVEAKVDGTVDHRHLHGFVGGVDPAITGNPNKQIDVTQCSDEELEMLEKLIGNKEDNEPIEVESDQTAPEETDSTGESQAASQ